MGAMPRYIFVTGGVVSSLGKGITAASLGAILEARGLTVSMIKLDPYLNVDPGTMSPFQHGEVYVTTDGTETATRRIPIWIVESGRLTLIPTDLPGGVVSAPALPDYKPDNRKRD